MTLMTLWNGLLRKWNGGADMVASYTEYKPSITALVNSMKYNPSALVERILNTDPKIRDSAAYMEWTDEFMDETMSCDLYESFEYMKREYRYAIAWGIDTKDLSWKALFLAAYDLYMYLKGEVLKGCGE